MTIKELTDRVRIEIDDKKKEYIPDDSILRRHFELGIKRLYTDVGASFKSEIYEVIDDDNPEIILPKEFLKPKLVLVNNIAAEQMAYEGVVAGNNLGLNNAGMYNAISQPPTIVRYVYYFRNGNDGRYLGVSPRFAGQRIAVTCVYDYIPEGILNGDLYSEPLPSVYDESLVYVCALEALTLMMSYDVADKKAENGKQFFIDLARDMKDTQAQIRIQTPMQIYNDLAQSVMLKRSILKEKYQEALDKLKNTISPMVKPPIFRYGQNILNKNYKRYQY
jgi:hypothetical protein